MTGFIDTCQLTGGGFKSCALIIDKGLRKVPTRISDMGSTGTGTDLATRKISEVSVAPREAGGGVIIHN